MPDITHIGQLKPDPHNARKHTPRNVGTIVNALHEVGAARSIVIDEHDVVLAGNGVIEGAAQAGIERVQVVDADGETIIAVRRTGLTQEQKTRLALYDNRASELAEWDIDVLASLSETDTLYGLFTGNEIDALLASLDKPTGAGGDDFDTTPDDAQTRVQYGDLWQLGDHRLLCGDSTTPEDVQRLMGGDAVECVFTDPPYNALKSWDKDEAKGETRLDPSKWFDNDNMEWPEYKQFLLDAFGLFEGHTAYVCCDYRIYPLVVDCLTKCGYEVKHCIVWKKNVWGLGKRYRFQHEFIVYACKGDAPFYGDRTQSDVWEVDVDRATDHNTPKPIELPTRAIRNSSPRKVIVADYFAGSGPTVIAAERTGRIARLMELKPANCDVILRRWEAETGREAVNIGRT